MALFYRGLQLTKDIIAEVAKTIKETLSVEWKRKK
jgi:hypothetical protein